MDQSLKQRGYESFLHKWTKGHATEEDIAKGTSNLHEKWYNAKSDEQAKLSVEIFPKWIRQYAIIQARRQKLYIRTTKVYQQMIYRTRIAFMDEIRIKDHVTNPLDLNISARRRLGKKTKKHRLKPMQYTETGNTCYLQLDDHLCNY